MINPAKLFKLKGAWKTFSENHPKFPKFLKAINNKDAIDVGTVIEIHVTKPSGETLSSNIKVTPSDKQLFSELKTMFE